MADWKEALARFGLGAEAQFDRLKARFKQRLNLAGPVQIVPYRGHGTLQWFYLKGRVLEDKGLRAATDDDTVWHNLLSMYRRIESDEVPGARVRLAFQGEERVLAADEEGYFSGRWQPGSLPAGRVWHDVHLQLVDDAATDRAPVTATGRVLVPPPQSAFGVISDVDDTILKTHATNLLKMARLTFLGNARTRLPFAGVAAFYRALQGGPAGDGHNPIFYVSSSPWNLYDLFVDFMDVRGIPAGPLFLRDVGIDRSKFLMSSHHDHKLAQIAHIMNVHADLPFILIGDSGQQDPEIYREVVRQFPGRVAAIYIRDVSVAGRDAEVDVIVKDVGAQGVPMLRLPDSAAAAAHAAAHGFIPAVAVPAIRAAISGDAVAGIQ